MTILKRLITSIFFCVVSSTLFAQTNNTVDILQNKYQDCLTKGINTFDCSKMFYQQIDSLLNFNYKKLRSTCDSLQKENLKDEQLEWLSKRDEYFKTTLAAFKKKNPKASPFGASIGTQEDAMVMVDENASFVKNRVVEIGKKVSANYSANNYEIEPTGFYSLDSKTETKKDGVYGYSGDIKVKKLNASKVVVKLFVCKGAPSYNIGTAFDTLAIKNNVAVYKSEDDSTCRLIFKFYRQGIYVEEKTDNYNFGCGFGHAVIADGFYKRKSYNVPTNKDLGDDPSN